LWIPTDLPAGTLLLWLDAFDFSTIALSSGRVSQWWDKSGNFRHVTQATASNRPTYLSSAFNNRGGINFASGTFQVLETPAFDFAPSGSFTVTVIASNTSSAYGRLTISKAAGINSFQSQYLGNDSSGSSLLSIHRNASVTSPVASKINTALGATIIAHQVVATADIGANTNSVRFYDNTPATLAFDSTIVNSSEGLGIGGNVSLSQAEPWGGNIGEIIVTGSISVKDFRLIQGYSYWRSGEQANLSTNHPFRNRAPLVTDI
jgi:hypothetical protein